MEKEHQVEAKKIRKYLEDQAKIYNYAGSGITLSDFDSIRDFFVVHGGKNCDKESCSSLPCLSRCSDVYWLDHARITGELMRRFAYLSDENQDLYKTTGLLHDADYLKFPHDRGQNKYVHPVPLINMLIKLNANPAMSIAILEHAPYLGLKSTSKLSLALKGCEELATLLSINNQNKLSRLSDFARELSDSLIVDCYIDEGFASSVRVFRSPSKLINVPLEQALRMKC